MSHELVIRVCSLVVGYFLGNILTAFIVGKKMGNVDPTTVGSKNPGTANVGAVLGKKAGIMVLAGDLIKTLVAIGIVCLLFPTDRAVAILYAGLGLTLGHDFPFWHHFKGGKGVAITVLFTLFYNVQAGVIIWLIALVFVILLQNLTLPPIFALVMFAVFELYSGNQEAGMIFLILVMIMSWQFRRDIIDFYRGEAKKVDILKGLKQKLRK